MPKFRAVNPTQRTGFVDYSVQDTLIRMLVPPNESAVVIGESVAAHSSYVHVKEVKPMEQTENIPPPDATPGPDGDSRPLSTTTETPGTPPDAPTPDGD